MDTTFLSGSPVRGGRWNKKKFRVSSFKFREFGNAAGRVTQGPSTRAVRRRSFEFQVSRIRKRGRESDTRSFDSGSSKKKFRVQVSRIRKRDRKSDTKSFDSGSSKKKFQVSSFENSETRSDEWHKVLRLGRFEEEVSSFRVSRIRKSDRKSDARSFERIRKRGRKSDTRSFDSGRSPSLRMTDVERD
jgi:hypothetical protein